MWCGYSTAHCCVSGHPQGHVLKVSNLWPSVVRPISGVFLLQEDSNSTAVYSYSSYTVYAQVAARPSAGATAPRQSVIACISAVRVGRLVFQVSVNNNRGAERKIQHKSLTMEMAQTGWAQSRICCLAELQLPIYQPLIYQPSACLAHLLLPT